LLFPIYYFIGALNNKFLSITPNSFTESTWFLIFAFILGHVVQARAKVFVENRIKIRYWNGVFLSELYLIKGSKSCTDIDRKKYIELAKERFSYTDEELSLLDTDSKESRELCQSIYRKLRAFIENNNVGGTVSIENTYYNFFRGLSQASIYSSLIVLLRIAYDLKTLSDRHWRLQNMDYKNAVSVLLLLFFIYAYFLFKERARQRGEYHVQAVYNTAYSLSLGGKTNEKHC